MIQTIIDGICKALHTVYPSYEIYDRDTEQGLTEPCFIVKCVHNVNRARCFDMARATDMFSVVFLCQDTGVIRSVTEQLFFILHTFSTTDGMMRAQNIESDVRGEQSVTTFSTTRTVWLKPAAEAAAEFLDYEGGLDG